MKLWIFKPTTFNVLLTVLIVSLPVFSENVAFEDGGAVVERYIPAHLLFSYLYMKDYVPFGQMLGFVAFVYFCSSIVTVILKILLGKLKRSR